MEFRLFNQQNCTIFDVIGKNEPAQTKSIGFLLSQSKNAMEKFLGLIYGKDRKKIKILLCCDWIVHCELPQNLNKSHQKRADIVICFYNGLIPKHAIIVEAKTIVALNSQSQTINQLNIYKQSKALKLFKSHNTTLVSLTSIKEISNNKSYSGVADTIHSITWQELILALESIVNPKKNDLINQYINYLNNLNIMKQYDKEILCIPAGKTLPQIQQYWLYECPTKGRQYKRRGEMRPLYLAFRKSGANGRLDTLYKVQDVVAIDLNDDPSIDALDNLKIYPNIKKRISGYVAACHPNGVKWLFILDKDNSITLPFPVEFDGNTKGMSGHIELTLKEVIGNPCPKVIKIPLKKNKTQQ